MLGSEVGWVCEAKVQLQTIWIAAVTLLLLLLSLLLLLLLLLLVVRHLEVVDSDRWSGVSKESRNADLRSHALTREEVRRVGVEIVWA